MFSSTGPSGRPAGASACSAGALCTAALLAGGAAVLLQLWKGNDLLSIFGATVLYMVLVQGVFG